MQIQVSQTCIHHKLWARVKSIQQSSADGFNTLKQVSNWESSQRWLHIHKFHKMVLSPLKNMKASWDEQIPYMKWKIEHV